VAGSLDALQGLSGGKKRPFVDPFAGLSGADLQNAGYGVMQDMRASDRADRDEIRAATMDPYESYISRAADRQEASQALSSPAWESFFGIMRGKEEAAKMSGRNFSTSGIGQPGFQGGRIAPGTTDVLESVGPSYRDEDFQHSFDPRSSTGYARGSIANRSGLSTQALKVLSGMGR
jgi:hypothetical protein